MHVLPRWCHYPEYFTDFIETERKKRPCRLSWVSQTVCLERCTDKWNHFHGQVPSRPTGKIILMTVNQKQWMQTVKFPAEPLKHEADCRWAWHWCLVLVYFPIWGEKEHYCTAQQFASIDWGLLGRFCAESQSSTVHMCAPYGWMGLLSQPVDLNCCACGKQHREVARTEAL